MPPAAIFLFVQPQKPLPLSLSRAPRRRGVPFPPMGKEPKDRQEDLPISGRSECFGPKRRSDRTPASWRGSYINRGSAAREVRDDESPPPGQGGPIAPPPTGFPRVYQLVPLFRAELPPPVLRLPSSSWRSIRFSRKRRSNRALASFPGSIANRENEACEICDDEAEPLSSSGRVSKGDRLSYP